MKKQGCSYRIAMAGVLVALAFILSYLESLLPAFIAVPGIKPGLANIASMTALYVLNWQMAVAVSLVRVVLSGLTFTGMSAMIYSLAGAVCSLLTMILLKRINRFSVTALSIAGGVAHNIGQILVACAVLGSSVIYYLPVLIASGAIAGLVTGTVTNLAAKNLGQTQKWRKR